MENINEINTPPIARAARPAAFDGMIFLWATLGWVGGREKNWFGFKVPLFLLLSTNEIWLFGVLYIARKPRRKAKSSPGRNICTRKHIIT